MKKIFTVLIIAFFSLSSYSQHKIEWLDRGLYVCRNHANNGNFISWRIYGTEWENGEPTVAFNVYRDGTLLTPLPIGKSNYLDLDADAGARYIVKTVENGLEIEEFGAGVWSKPWWGIPLNVPSGGTTPDGVAYTYSPNDMSVGDVDADGQLEYILKWDPSNSQDNSKSGYTGNVFIDCYEFDGTFKWRIDLGKNIRAGAHYTQFIVYDLDNDGKAELACKTAPGTKDGTGNYLSSGPASSDNDGADYRTSGSWPGFITSGPEYLTIFNGETGAELSTVYYIPNRDPNTGWGKSTEDYNRVDRFLACVAYLDAKNPSLIMCRGYYGRTALTAWNWNGTALSQLWTFDTGNNSSNAYYGQGNHNLAVGDLDGDGHDEIQYGAMAIDHDGTGLYPTGYGHGDAGHLTDMDPNVDGLEYFMPHEEGPHYGCHLINTKSQKILFSTTSSGDNGRGVCYDVDENNFGYECWSYDGQGMTDVYGNVLHAKLPTTAGNGETVNFGIWWDGDLMRELLDRTVITKYNASNETTARTWTIYSDIAVGMNNGSKNNPCLMGDILGDWREEIILRSSNNDYIYILPTTVPTDYNYYTLLHDVQYREAIAWQNVGYNQPPHPSFYLGTGMSAPPAPDIEYTLNTPDCAGVLNGTAHYDGCNECVGGTTGKTACYVDCNGDRDGTATVDDCGVCSGGNTGVVACSSAMQGESFCSADGIAESNNDGFGGDGFLNFNNVSASTGLWYLYADSAATATIGIRFANGSGDARNMSVSVNGAKQTTFNAESTGSWTQWETENVSLVLKKGVNAIELVADVAVGGPNIDLFALNSPAIHAGQCAEDCSGQVGGTAFTDHCGECVGGGTGRGACSQIKAQAEDIACVFDGTIDTDNIGFEGDGFINGYNSDTTKIEFRVYAAEMDAVTFGIGYANGKEGDRSARIEVNGAEAVASLSMPSTSAWTSYADVETDITLDAGINEIGVYALSAEGFGNIDYFYLYGNAEFFECNLAIQTIELQPGWNLMSINVHPADSTVEGLFGGKDAIEIKSQDSFWKLGLPPYLNSLQTITPGQGYLVKMENGGMLVVPGLMVDASTHQQNSVPGWNLMGVSYQAPTPFSSLFDDENCQIIKNFDGFWKPDESIYSIDSLEPGKAYFFKM